MTVTSTFMGRALALNESGCLDLILAPSGTSALEGVKLDVTDTTTVSSGYGSALYLHVAQSGAKTGDQFNAIALDLTLKAASTFVSGEYIYISQSGSPTLSGDQINGMVIYLEEIGATASINLLALETTHTTKATGIDSMIHFTCQGAGVSKTAFQFSGTHNPDYFLQIVSTADMVAASTQGAQTSTFRLKCLVGSTTAYIQLAAA